MSTSTHNPTENYSISLEVDPGDDMDDDVMDMTPAAAAPSTTAATSTRVRKGRGFTSSTSKNKGSSFLLYFLSQFLFLAILSCNQDGFIWKEI